MRSLLLIFAIIFFFVPLSGQASSSDTLDQSNNGWHLDDFSGTEHSFYKELEIFHDKNGNTSFEEVQKNDSLFSTNTTSENLQLDDVYWAKLTLQGHSEKTANYLFSFSIIWSGAGWQNNDAWLVHEDGTMVQQQTGFGFPKKEKSVPSVANLARFEIKQNEKVTLFVRYQGAMKEKYRIPARVSISLLKEDMFPILFEGYPFKGHFEITNSRSVYNSNNIINHEQYVDLSGKATIDDIAKNWDQLNKKDPYSIGYEADKVYWIKARFYGSPYFNGKQILTFQCNEGYSFDYVDAYLMDMEGEYQHQRTGDRVSLKERPYNFWSSLIQLDISPSDTIDLYIRMEGADPRLLCYNILLRHVDTFSLFPSQVNYAWKDGLFFGILGIQIIFFLLLFFIEREQIHLYFGLTGLGMFFILGFQVGVFNRFEPFPALRNIRLSLFFFRVLFSYLQLSKIHSDLFQLF